LRHKTDWAGIAPDLGGSMSYAEARFRAVEKASERLPVENIFFAGETGAQTMEELFGSYTFNEVAMRKYLSKAVSRRLQGIISDPQVHLDDETASAVAHGMKEWALDRGATHFCHWFQPLTGATAEKHDSFLDMDGGQALARFSGSQLLQGEPDASSFPSGGMRATFEARGYTGWDPSSPAFLLEGPGGLTLTIPSVFVSYHGEVLGKKTPLLRASDAVDGVGRDLLKLFGKSPKRVFPTVGAEQEYFLVDRSLAALRPDLSISQRTVLGAPPPKGQELEDQYFGSIPERAISFMQELDYELYRLGIPAKTRHNEVAPSQFEIAPIFEEANLAADHNQLLMATMKRLATRHDFVVCTHEKPFAGINGSGKHLNWSLSTNEGENLLEPGKTPEENIQFLVVLASVLKAVYGRANLLRASIASSGNDHRLGANEAPPAILSVFLGSELAGLLDAISEGKALTSEGRSEISLGVHRLPKISKDTTDRNRTSPFAFTGNKFEFRALGGSASISGPATILSAAFAESLREAVRHIQGQLDEGKDLKEAAMTTVTQFVKESNPVRFEGDNYSADWLKMAEERGLPHLHSTPEALDQYATDESKEFFSRMGIFNEAELDTVYHVELDRYVKQLAIEAALLEDMARTQILPAATSYAGQLAGEVKAMRDAEVFSGSHAPLQAIVEGICSLRDDLNRLSSERKEAEAASLRESAGRLQSMLVGVMAEVRASCDFLEAHVADAFWPIPKYREMLFPG
jgi:glutamine synthetase